MTLPNARDVTLILCEDVRAEVGNKLSLMGVFGATVEVETLPMTLVMFAAVLTMVDPEPVPSLIAHQLVGPNGKIVATGPPLPTQGPPPGDGPRTMNAVFRYAAVLVATPGAYEFQVLLQPGGAGVSRQFLVKLRGSPATRA